MVMGSSNEVTTDENGYFRHRQGYPLVVIFDSKDVKIESSSELSWQKPVMTCQPHRPKGDVSHFQPRSGKLNTQPLKFVNKSSSVDFGRRARRAIRSHATKDCQRRNQGHQISANQLSDTESTPFHDNTSETKKLECSPNYDYSRQITHSIWQPFEFLGPLVEFPVNMEPYMYSLIQRYLLATSSFVEATKLDDSHEATQQNWFRLALTDAALFQCILCGSALFSDRCIGRADSLERSKHMNEAIRLLNAKLQVLGDELADSTLVAVAHLAEFEECVMGNFAKWKLHLDGLHRMAEIRGGFMTLSGSLKRKLWRAEISGCISTLSKPRFLPPYSQDISIPSPSNQSFTELGCGLQGLAMSFQFHGDFIKLLLQLQDLAALLNYPEQNFLNTFRLLGLCEDKLFSLRPTQCYAPRIINNIIIELCSIAILLYLKIVDDYRLRQQGLEIRAPLSASTLVLQQLKSYIEMIDSPTDEVKALILWTLFLGGVTVVGTKERAWFVARLVKLTMEWSIRIWQEAERVLIDFLWVENIHKSPCEEVWEEVLVTREVLF